MCVYVRVWFVCVVCLRIGLNLAVADDVVFCELMWTPSDLVQAEDRVNLIIIIINHHHHHHHFHHHHDSDIVS